ETLAYTDMLPPEGTTSMQRDIIAGRPSELEAQNGAVARLGRDKGIRTPVHDLVYRCLLPQERTARGEVG
ncbi:MAG: ketopantoate reductase family protein, partial [Gemmatimonadales bacterium]